MIYFTIFNYLFLSPLFIVPFLYKSRAKYMVKFYSRMSSSIYCRRLYAFVIEFLLIMFHFTYYWQHTGEKGIMLSTILLIYMFNPNRTVGLLQGIRNNRCVGGFLFTLALASIFFAHTYTIGVTLSYILLASVFYPSYKARGKAFQEKVYKSYGEIVEDTVSTYFK